MIARLFKHIGSRVSFRSSSGSRTVVRHDRRLKGPVLALALLPVAVAFQAPAANAQPQCPPGAMWLTDNYCVCNWPALPKPDGGCSCPPDMVPKTGPDGGCECPPGTVLQTVTASGLPRCQPAPPAAREQPVRGTAPLQVQPTAKEIAKVPASGKYRPVACVKRIMAGIGPYVMTRKVKRTTNGVVLEQQPYTNTNLGICPGIEKRDDKVITILGGSIIETTYTCFFCDPDTIVYEWPTSPGNIQCYLCPQGFAWEPAQTPPRCCRDCPPGMVRSDHTLSEANMMLESAQTSAGLVSDPINYCELPKAQQTKASAEITATPAPNTAKTPACPAGYDLRGDRCERRALAPPGLVQVQPPTKVTAPGAPPPHITTKVPPVPSQSTGCGRGQVLSNGHCCPPGMTWIGGRCTTVAVQPRRCPPGTKGIPPRCRPVIATRRTCPPGTRGTPPYCRPIAFKYQPKYRPRPQPQQTLR